MNDSRLIQHWSCRWWNLPSALPSALNFPLNYLSYSSPNTATGLWGSHPSLLLGLKAGAGFPFHSGPNRASRAKGPWKSEPHPAMACLTVHHVHLCWAQGKTWQWLLPSSPTSCPGPEAQNPTPSSFPD